MRDFVTKGLAVALSTLAGFVDALGYLSLGGLFVAFMSGNSTILGITATGAAGGQVVLASGLVASFVIGVMLGTLVGHRWGRRRAPLVLCLVAVMLIGAWAVHRADHLVGAGLAMAAAMGTVNTVYAREGQSGLGLTYMTGTLVRLGHRVAEAVMQIGGWGALIPDILLWLGMVAGALLGALAYASAGLEGLWIAVVASLLMALAAWWIAPKA